MYSASMLDRDRPKAVRARNIFFFAIPWLVLFVAVVLGNDLHLDDHPYLAVLAATFAGVFAGGALALWSDRIQEANRRKQEHAADAVRLREARRSEMNLQLRVVGLLHDELEVSANAMTDPAGRAKRPRPDLFFTPLPISTWLALSASGELTHVPTPELLGSFAEAYHWVGIVNSYERQMLDLQFHPSGVTGAAIAPGVGGKALREALDRLKATLQGLDEPAQQVISRAFETANEEFARIQVALDQD